MLAKTEIDSKLLTIPPPTKCKGRGRPITGIMTLLTPMQDELNAAAVMTVMVRRSLMSKLLNDELVNYNQELLETVGSVLYEDI